MAMYKGFRDLEIPPFLMTEGWVDQSWKNDSCPHSTRKLDLAQEGDYPVLYVWVEYDERAEREEEIDDKYAVEVYLTEEDYENGKVLRLYAGEDGIEAQIAIRNAPEEIRKLKNKVALASAIGSDEPYTCPEVVMPKVSMPRPYGRSNLIHEICTEFARDERFAPMAVNHGLYVSLGKTLVAKIFLFSYTGQKKCDTVVVDIIGAFGKVDGHKFLFSDYFVVDKEFKLLSQNPLSYDGSPYICSNVEGVEDWYAGVRPESTAPIVRAITGYATWWRMHYAF